MTRAVILLSGGLDSATVLAIARSEGRECHALSIVYGQRHIVELEAARRVAAAMGVDEHVVHSLDLRVFGASALTSEIEVPKDAKATLNARSVNGAITVSGLNTTEASGRRIRNLESQLNGGGPELDVRVTNGRITIEGK